MKFKITGASPISGKKIALKWHKGELYSNSKVEIEQMLSQYKKLGGATLPDTTYIEYNINNPLSIYTCFLDYCHGVIDSIEGDIIPLKRDS